MTVMNKGREFEGIVGELFSRMGFYVERNKLMKGKSGAVHEIDVYGETRRSRQKRKRVAVECKYKQNGDKVRKSDVANFLLKLEDLGLNEGYLVTNSSFSDYSVKTAGVYNVHLVDSEKLSRLLKKSGLSNYLSFLKSYKENTLTDAVLSAINFLDELGVLKR